MDSFEISGLAVGDQFEIWADTSPPSVTVGIRDTSDGLLRMYNIWDMGPGRHHASQSATSGMLKQEDGNLTTYRCNDIGLRPAFDRLVFQVSKNLPRR